MSSMTDLTVTADWQLVYTAAGTVTVVLENRSTANDALIHIRTGAIEPTGDVAALALPRAGTDSRGDFTRSLTLASGDKVYVKLVNTAGSARVTLLS